MDLEIATAEQADESVSLALVTDADGVTFRHYVAGRWSVIESVGEIDIAATPAMRATLYEAALSDVIFDLRRVTFIDASGLSVLAAAHHRGVLSGGSVRLVGPGRTVRKVLEITQMDGLMTIFDGLDEALQ